MRFPKFSGEWKREILNDVCTFHNGRAYKQNELLSDGKYRVLRVGNFFTNDSWYYSDLELDDEKVAVNGDLLYAWSASFGPRFWTGEKVIYHYHIWKIDSFQQVSKEFLFYFLERDTEKIKNEVQGGTMVHITKGDMEKREILYPSILEQSKIARLLSLLDERIATQNKIIEDLKKLKSAIVEMLLCNQNGESFKLRDVGCFVRGLTYANEDVTENKAATTVIRANNLNYGNNVDKDEVVYVNKTPTTSQILRKGDIVICMANGSSSLVGKNSYYPFNDGQSTIGAFCGIYRTSYPFVKWLMQSQRYKRLVYQSLQGGNGAIANLNGDDILNMSFPLIENGKSQSIIFAIDAIEKSLMVNKSLQRLYYTQKSYLLKQMFI